MPGGLLSVGIQPRGAVKKTSAILECYGGLAVLGNFDVKSGRFVRVPHGALANVSFRAKGVKAGINSASPAALKGATDLCSHCGPAKQKHMEGEEIPPTAGRSALRLEAFRKLRCQTN